MEEKINPNKGMGNGGRPPLEIPTETLLEAIEGSYGNMTVIKERLGVSRGTATKYITCDEQAMAAFNDERHAIVDAAEKGMFTLIAMGEPSMIRFALSSKMAESRGWGAAAGNVNLGIGGANIYTGEKGEEENKSGLMAILTIDKIEAIEKVLLGQQL